MNLETELRDIIHDTLWSRVTLRYLLGRGPSPCTVAAQRILQRVEKEHAMTITQYKPHIVLELEGPDWAYKEWGP